MSTALSADAAPPAEAAPRTVEFMQAMNDLNRCLERRGHREVDAVDVFWTAASRGPCAWLVPRDVAASHALDLDALGLADDETFWRAHVEVERLVAARDPEFTKEWVEQLAFARRRRCKPERGARRDRHEQTCRRANQILRGDSDYDETYRSTATARPAVRFLGPPPEGPTRMRGRSRAARCGPSRASGSRRSRAGPSSDDSDGESDSPPSRSEPGRHLHPDLAPTLIGGRS